MFTALAAAFTVIAAADAEPPPLDRLPLTSLDVAPPTARVRGGTRVACVNAPTRRCHVRASGRTFFVPRGSARVVPGGGVRVVGA